MRHGLPHLDRADRNFCMIARWGHLGPNIGEFISLVTLMSVAPRILSSISSSWSQPMMSAHAKQYLAELAPYLLSLRKSVAGRIPRWVTARALLCTADFDQFYSHEPQCSGAENDGSFGSHVVLLSK
jgi:hypothetical protein